VLLGGLLEDRRFLQGTTSGRNTRARPRVQEGQRAGEDPLLHCVNWMKSHSSEGN